MPGYPTVNSSQSQAVYSGATQSNFELSATKTGNFDSSVAASRDLHKSENHSSRTSTAISPSSLSPMPQKKDSKYFCTHCPEEFKWKGDWKRHEAHKHEHQDEYTCESCPRAVSCTRGPYYTKRDFNRHHRKVHKCHSCPKTDACRRGLPKKRAWGCGFCSKALLTWDERIDHIAQHYDEGKKMFEWECSSVILSLLLQPSMVDVWKALITSQFGYQSGQWPVCRWFQENTKDLQAGLEGGYQDSENLAIEALNLAELRSAVAVTQSIGWTENIVDSISPPFAMNHESSTQPTYVDALGETHFSPSAFVSTPRRASGLAIPSSSTGSDFPFHYRNEVYHDTPSQYSLTASQWAIHPPVVSSDGYQPQNDIGSSETSSRKVLRSQARPSSDRSLNPL